MKTWAAVRPMLAILAIAAALLLAQAGLVSIDKAGMLIPSPGGTAAQLVGALAARRAAGARNQLAQELQQQTTEADLLRLARAIEAGPLGGIADAHEIDAQQQGDQASARVRVKFKDLSEQTLEFPLVSENGLWKVTSLAPLEALPKGSGSP